MLPIVATLVISASCSKDNGNDEKQTKIDIQLTSAQKLLAENGNRFAINAFKAANDETTNIALSTYGLQTTLAILANGTSAEATREIKSALYAEQSTVDQLNSYYKTMTDGLLVADSKVNVKVANAVWSANGISCKEEFRNALSTYYKAPVSSIDFSSPNALEAINKWVSSATNGEISKFLDKIPASTSICLANALTFNGKWTTPFQGKNTKQVTFTNWKDDAEKCLSMTGDISVYTSSNSKVDMVELDYGSRAYSMDIIKMKDKTKINEFISSMSYSDINELITNLWPAGELTVQLPKFKASYKYDLVNTIKKLGINKLFESEGFSEWSGTSIAITKYYQQMSITVDESGTRASSATVSEGQVTAAPWNGYFTVDSPFIYLVRERSTGAILLIGKVQTMASMQ